jgi:hypothetical protein
MRGARVILLGRVKYQESQNVCNRPGGIKQAWQLQANLHTGDKAEQVMTNIDISDVLRLGDKSLMRKTLSLEIYPRAANDARRESW